jgi:cytochrome d ubiquinol oxidase subunit I
VGLDRFRPQDRPPVLVSFASYHIMIGLGVAFIALTTLASFLRWRRRLFETRWLLWVFVFAVVGPLVANQLGWVAAEVGRQPWIVHPPLEWTADGDVVVGPSGVVEYDETKGLRTVNAVSPSISASQVVGSLIGFGLIYLGLLAVWLYVLDGKIRQGPEQVGAGTSTEGDGLLSAVSGLAAEKKPMTTFGGGG